MSTSTEVTKVAALAINDIMSMGKVFADSGMFADAKNTAQAVVKIQAGQEIGIPPFAAMSGIHIIKGKVSIGAGLMASSLKANGKYDYKVVTMDDSICVIDFYKGKTKEGTSTFSIEDAKKAGTQNLEKFPRNMLFARALSNGVKWFCPDIFSMPVYTPEELGEIVTEDISHEDLPTASNKFQQRYENDSELLQVVETTITVKDLGDLYSFNKEWYDSVAEVKEAFDKRKTLYPA